MTIDEAIQHCEEVAVDNIDLANTLWLWNTKEYAKCEECAKERRQLAEWLKELKALKEQEPCEDCVSREEVHNLIIPWLNDYLLDETREALETIDYKIEDLPSVTSQPKTVLYSGDGYADGHMVYDMAECPNCGYRYEEDDKDWGLPFCPNCGQALNWESEGVE